MRKQDEFPLRDEGQTIIDVHNGIQMWDSKQHHFRIWEYAMAQKALKAVFGNRTGLRISDHGCGCGYLSPILYWLGHDVVMYEIWVWGNEEAFALEQMRRVSLCRGALAGKYEVRHRNLGGLTSDDRDFDAAFCISTLEHIKDYQAAFIDLCRAVKPGGLLFATTDFAEDQEDHYRFSNLRAGKMFNKSTYEELQKIGEGEGMQLLGDKYWEWSDECVRVNDYSFASIAMTRGN